MANVASHVSIGRWFDSFWVCNGATLLCGLGLILRQTLLVTSGFVWLVPGTALWATEATLLGSSFAPASYLLHISGFAAAVYGVRRLGAHPSGYLGALGLFVGLLLCSRLLPAEANVNCAFGPRASWKVWAALDLPHHLTVALLALVVCWAMNRLADLWSRVPVPISERSRSRDPRS